MIMKVEKERLKKVISEAVLLLCKNSCALESSDISVEGIIGITLHENEVILVSFKEEIKDKPEASSLLQRTNGLHELVNTEDSSNAEANMARMAAPKGVEEVIEQTDSSNIDLVKANYEANCARRKTRKRKRSNFSEQIQVPNANASTVTTSEFNISTFEDSVEATVHLNLLQSDKNVSVKAEVIDNQTDLSDDNFSIKHSSNSSINVVTSLDKIRASKLLENESKTVLNDNIQDITVDSAFLQEEVQQLPFNSSKSSLALKSESNEENEDDDCFFVKSELYDLSEQEQSLDLPHNTVSSRLSSDIRLHNQDGFFSEASLPPTQLDVVQNVRGIRTKAQQYEYSLGHTSTMKARYLEYVNRGCVTQTGDTFSSRNCLITCNMCSATFERWWDCAEHMDAIHLKLLKHVCSDCGESFAWRAQLSRHHLHSRCPARLGCQQ